MAQVNINKVGTIHSIGPGETKHHWWNNAGDTKVWAVTADAFVPTDGPTPPPNSIAKVEVTRVENWQKFSSGGSVEREIHYWVKNTGSIKAYYTVQIATIGS